MADVLIVCVREDEPQAKALADMFEAAGFSIGGAPSNDAALRSSGAGVVVWSQASIRSRPFLDAAQRVINADKAVVASLIEPPPPSSIGDAPSFDLSRWSGDPNDPALDPLFFAVDRMVNTARAGVGAAAAEETAYEPPPAPRAPSPRRTPPPPAAPAPRAPSADALGSEAEHWRAIRDSRNASDFMDYLARYGPDGAFSEVAELRLKQLTSQDEAPPRAPTRAPVRPASRPAARAEAPPRRSDSPVRMPDPPSRRETVLAPARRPSMDRGGGLDRPFDRMADLREPPKGEGGALRTFVLIALLGGAALAGGLYFGGMGDVGASASRPQIEDVAAATPSAPPPDATYDELEEAPSVPLSSTVEEQERPIRVASRPEREPPATTRREEPRTTPRTQTPPQPQQAVTQTAASTPTTGGPISLSPGSQQTTTTPSPSVATPPPPSLTTPASTTRTDPSELRGPAGSVVWTQRPSQRRISELYPQRALRQGVGGRVQLDCSVTPSLTLNCRIATETPAGEGFGRAALSAASSYRARPTLSDGTSAVGTTTRLAVNFQAPQE